MGYIYSFSLDLRETKSSTCWKYLSLTVSSSKVKKKMKLKMVLILLFFFFWECFSNYPFFLNAVAILLLIPEIFLTMKLKTYQTVVALCGGFCKYLYLRGAFIYSITEVNHVL